AQTAIGFSLQRLEAGIAAPVVGFLFDRLGPRRLILSGMIVAGSGLILMSRIDSLAGFYAAFLMTAVGLSFGWMGPPMYAVTNWFVKKRSRALSLLLASTSLGGFLVPPLVALIAQEGWRTGMVAIGIGFCAISIPMAIVVKHRPEKYGYLPDGDVADAPGAAPPPEMLRNGNTHRAGDSAPRTDFGVRHALRTRGFWCISLATMLSMLMASAVMVLEIPHLENAGISRESAGLAVTFTALLGMIGSLTGGFLGDVVEKPRVLAAALMLQCSGMIIFALVSQPWHLIPFVLLYGIGFGATIPLRPALLADYFGRANIGTIMGLMMSVALLGSVVSPLMAGWFFDSNGSYQGIFIIYAVASLLAIPAVLLARRPVFEA
ncbi:MAG: MFS transporter, partial [Dehalococcoidia bacterium]